MATTKLILNKLKQDITEHELHLKAIIQVIFDYYTILFISTFIIFQDIELCIGPLAELHALNNTGRSKISALRKNINSLADIAKEENDPVLLNEVILFREKLAR